MGSRRISGQDKGLRKMRSVSTKRAAINRRVADPRRAWLEARPVRLCWFCDRLAVLVHEIAKGWSLRVAAVQDPCTWAAACWACNDGPLNDYKLWPVPRQLAAKQLYDPQHYDLAAFNRLRGDGDDHISQRQVDVWRLSLEARPGLSWMEDLA